MGGLLTRNVFNALGLEDPKRHFGKSPPRRQELGSEAMSPPSWRALLR